MTRGRSVKKWVLLGLCWTAGTAGLTAQGAPTTLDDIGAGCCLVRVQDGNRIASGTFRGRPHPGAIYLHPCRGLLCPAPGDSLVIIPPGARLDLREGSHAASAGFRGALVGALALGLTAAVANTGDDVSTGQAILIGAPIGAVAGGVAGALLGSRKARWRPLER